MDMEKHIMFLENEVKRLRVEKSSWRRVAERLQAELDETKTVLKHQVKCLKHCQAAGEQLRAALEIMTTDRDLHLRWLKAHRWIPVSKRLPKENGKCYRISNGIWTDKMWYNGGWVYQDSTEYTGPSFTHWKPIILPGEEASDGPS